MIDDLPYIIVDNQIIQPISRSPRPDSAAGRTDKEQEQNFGVVDRVTLSREGREKSRLKVNDDAQQPLLENRPQGLTYGRHPMLTYSPKSRR